MATLAPRRGKGISYGYCKGCRIALGHTLADRCYPCEVAHNAAIQRRMNARKAGAA